MGVCASSRGQERTAAVVKEKGIQYPAARDATRASEKAWQVHYYPTFAVVDRKGIVRVIGMQPQNVDKNFEKLLAELAP